jgi:sugar/nucleoside kinase (ribokinase family)
VYYHVWFSIFRVASQGRFATIVCENGATREYPVDILPVEQIVDTNAAGDAFVGGFLAQVCPTKGRAWAGLGWAERAADSAVGAFNAA